MYCIKGTRKSTLLLVCHRNFKVLQYFKVLLGNHAVLWSVPCYEFISKWVLEGTDQVLSWVLLHSMFRYPVTKITVCWWSNLTFDFFIFFLSKQLTNYIFSILFYFICRILKTPVGQILTSDRTWVGRISIKPLQGSPLLISIKIGIFSTNK